MSTDLIMDIDQNETKTYLTVTLRMDNTKICTCKVTMENRTMSIVSWYTEKQYMHQGYGIKVLKHAVTMLYQEHGKPEKIKYIWNGANSYVMDWMNRHFAPVSMLPLAVQKYSDADDWEAHIYNLDVDKFLQYFDIGN